jgi:hypothetical protein
MGGNLAAIREVWEGSEDVALQLISRFERLQAELSAKIPYLIVLHFLNLLSCHSHIGDALFWWIVSYMPPEQIQ